MYESVTFEQFRFALEMARDESPLIASATSPVRELPEDARYFLAPDMLSGFGITADGTLIGVFSLIRGRGDELVESAISSGASVLDCFDGYLPGFYQRHGFRETHREPNWTPGGPDVVFMAHERVLVGV